MVDEIIKVMKEKSVKTLEVVKHDFSLIRTGRASASVLDVVLVEQYGQQMLINQMASITVPEARQLLVTPWDQGALDTIEKAIQKANLGVSVNSDGKKLRVIFPDLTEERRKEYAKMAHAKAEDGRVAVRNERRNANDKLKKMLKDSDIGEDDEHRALDQIQKITDNAIKDIDKILAEKESEIMKL